MLEQAERESAAAADGEINSKELHERIEELEKELEVGQVGWLIGRLASMHTDIRFGHFPRRKGNVMRSVPRRRRRCGTCSGNCLVELSRAMHVSTCIFSA